MDIGWESIAQLCCASCAILILTTLSKHHPACLVLYLAPPLKPMIFYDWSSTQGSDNAQRRSWIRARMLLPADKAYHHCDVHTLLGLGVCTEMLVSTQVCTISGGKANASVQRVSYPEDRCTKSGNQKVFTTWWRQWRRRSSASSSSDVSHLLDFSCRKQL